jgi:hypothetical protein
MTDLLLTPELSAELTKYGWQQTDEGIESNRNPKYPLIQLEKLRPDKGQCVSRVRVRVDINQYINANGVVSGLSATAKEHLVDTKRPQWRRTLQRWFGCAVMELLPAHQKLADRNEAERRRKLGFQQAIQAVYPCSDSVAQFVISRANFHWKETPGELPKILSFSCTFSYRTFQATTESLIRETLTNLLRFLDSWEKSTNEKFASS